MFLTGLMLLVALCLSSVAAYYSIVGLAAIFAAAVVPIIIMGSILEVAKLVVTVWLHEYWRQCRWIMKLYLVPAVAVLMLLTSMGIFGFLSRAHLDQAVPTGDVAAQVALFDEKLRVERDNIEAAKRALAQMDAQVDQRLSRSDDEKGAERAVQIRRMQARERQQLQTEIQAAQQKITALNEERAPIASTLRKAEAEVGPIKYIAALIYGDNPDANLLERAVRWVIIVLVAVFDPLAVIMLLASTESWRWERQQRKLNLKTTTQDDQSGKIPQDPVPDPDLFSATNLQPETVPDPTPVSEPKNTARLQDDIEDREIQDQEQDPSVKDAMKLWKRLNPQSTLKAERSKLSQGLIKKLPWMDLLYTLPRQVRFGFGKNFPKHPLRGDLWCRTHTVPNQLFRFNGSEWINLDKDVNDSYTSQETYINYLIAEMQAGRYDPDMLTTKEADQIESKLRIGNERNQDHL